MAERLQRWFADAGFRSRRLGADAASAAFYIERQGQSGRPLTTSITNYDQARAAFLDSSANIIEIIPFVLEARDAGVGLHIVNARRQRED